jgi:hypothetical protein
MTTNQPPENNDKSALSIDANLQNAAQTLKSFQEAPEDETAEQKEACLRELAGNLIGNINNFKLDQVNGLSSMLVNQASLLDALFNRVLQQAGLDDAEKFCKAKAEIALKAQHQCRVLLNFVAHNYK